MKLSWNTQFLNVADVNTAVRQPTQYLLTIENPLGKEGTVTFPEEDWWKCDDPAVKVKRLSDMMGASEGTYEIEYRPLVPTGPNGEVKESRYCRMCYDEMEDE